MSTTRLDPKDWAILAEKLDLSNASEIMISNSFSGNMTAPFGKKTEYQLGGFSFHKDSFKNLQELMHSKIICIVVKSKEESK